MREKKLSLLLIFISILIFFSCNKQENSMVKKELFGTLQNRENIYSYTLTNKSGMSATIINYGATVVKLKVPDKNGNIEDVILGYDSLSGYVNGASYFGGIVGRYAVFSC